MRKNIFLFSFILLVGATFSWFIGKTGLALLHYFRLSEQIPIVLEKWEIKEKGANEYVLSAAYFYNYRGKNYKSESEIGRSFPNPWAAEIAKARFEEKKWDIWVNPKKPASSSLEKKFPLKPLISSLVLLGLMGYFIFLGFFVRKEESGRSYRNSGS